MMSYKDVLIPLRDVNVIDIKTNEYFQDGCEENDYWDEYIQTVSFEFDDGRHFELRFARLYSYALDVESFTKSLLNNYERYAEMDYDGFEATMIDLQSRSRDEIEQLVPNTCDEIEQLAQNATSTNTTTTIPTLVNKDVYALVKDPNEIDTKVFWDVRNHKESNDDAVIQLGEDWGRTVIKLVDNGQPLYQNATGDQLASIPSGTSSQNFQSSVICDTLKYAQQGLSLNEFQLQSSLDDIQLKGLEL